MGEAFQVVTEMNDQALNKEIPPLALQQLVENAIKHNMATKERPLIITIKTTKNNLIVFNNLNKRESAFSEKTGLNNLMQRFAMLTDRKVEVRKGEALFEVEIPLL